jgi:serine phosphatase RsbU (regulator of sigma subunit)
MSIQASHRFFKVSVALVAFLLVTGSFNRAYCGITDRDSLNRVIQFSKNNIERANAYVELSELVYLTNIDSVVPLCRSAIKMLDTAVADTSRAVRLRVLNIKAHALNNIGSVFYSKGDLREAIDYYYEGLKLREAVNDKPGLAESLNNLGLLYKSQGNITKAIDNYEKSLTLYTEVKDIRGESTSLGNIGVLYLTSLKLDTALAFFFKGLSLYDSIGNKNGVIKMQNYIATTYQLKKEYDEALKYAFKSLDLLKDVSDKEDEATTLRLITQLEFNKNNYPAAEEYGQKALQDAKDLGFPSDIMNTAKLMYEIYADGKKWSNALDMHVLYSTMQDSVNSQEIRKEVLQKEFQYEYGKKEAEMQAEQEKKDLMTQAESKRQKIAIWLALIIAIATGTIAILVFRSLKTTRKQKLIIEEQKTLVEQKNKDILDSITYAKRLQNAILPQVSAIKQYFPESFVLYRPKDIVAGDFYWMQEVGDSIFIAACDCTGHGVPGAMVSVVCSGALNRAVKEFNITDPGKILDKTREIVIETLQKSDIDVKDGMDISLCAIKRSEPTIVNWAGANAPLWYAHDAEVQTIIADKQPIGMQDGQKDFTTNRLKLSKGDTIYMFSDGYIDQFGGPEGKKFKSKPFRELIKSMSPQSMDEQRKTLDTTFENWKGDQVQTDDVCIIGIRL